MQNALHGEPLEYARFALVATHRHMWQLPPCEVAAKLRKSCSAQLIPTRAFTRATYMAPASMSVSLARG